MSQPVIVNPIGHINVIGPFETFRDYNAKVERCRKQPRRLECRHRPVEHKDGSSRITRLAAYSRGSVFA
jgi:hypothetical protein